MTIGQAGSGTDHCGLVNQWLIITERIQQRKQQWRCWQWVLLAWLQNFSNTATYSKTFQNLQGLWEWYWGKMPFQMLQPFPMPNYKMASVVGAMTCGLHEYNIIFQVNLGQPVPIEAKDNGGGSDNWSYKSWKLQPNHHQQQQTNIQFFYRQDALPVAQLTVSKHWMENITLHGLAYPTPLTAPGYLGEGWHVSHQPSLMPVQLCCENLIITLLKPTASIFNKVFAAEFSSFR